jgi:hypothetical protein
MTARRTVLALLMVLVWAAPASAAAPRWVRLNPVTAPPASAADLMAYDAAARQLVLLDQVQGSTWTWDGATWTPQATLTHPGPRSGAAMAYDAATKQVILFGGQSVASGSSALSDTWSWDGSRWTQLSPATSPPPMAAHTLAYDPATSQLVLFGVEPTQHRPVTWTWDGTTWTQQSPATSPPARLVAVLGYDPAGKSLILFGGAGLGAAAGTVYGDTWRWTGSAWTQLSPVTSPPARTDGSLALDGASNRLLLAAGADSAGHLLNDTWTWTGTTWKALTPASLLLPRFDAPMAYDPDAAETVLFGGGNDFSGAQNAETWVYTNLQVQTRSLPRGAVGVPYSTTLQAIAGKAPYTWSVSAGRLPAGLTLSAAGVLSGTPTAAGTASVTLKVVDGSATPQSATRTLSLPVNPAPVAGFWTAGSSGVSAFGLNATSASAPTARLTGALTGLAGPGGLAFDEVGELYVANSSGPSIEEFAAGSNGNVAPVRTISGNATGLAVPAGVTVFQGRIYVTDEAANAIRVWQPSANGNTPPGQVISGPHTGLSAPWGITIDAQQHIWVANYGNNTLAEYAPNAVFDAQPLQTIAGPSTGLNSPQGLGQDAAGNLLVANFFGGSVTSYAHTGPFGDVPPKSTFRTPAATGPPSLPEGVDVDTGGRLFVADEDLGVLVFPKSASSPSTTINGGASGLAGADAVAVAPPLAITTTKLPAAALGRRYSGRLEAVLGDAPLRWRVVRGHLPRGLHLARSGRITGRPRRAGRSRFTVAVRDAGSPAQTAQERVTLVVGRAPSIRRIRSGRGPARGGRRVTITGTGFSTRRGATTFDFGRLRALAVRCSSRTRCTMRTPPHSRGAVRVTATVGGLASGSSRAARYRFTR